MRRLRLWCGGLGRALGLAAREAAAGAAVFGAHPFVLYGVLLPLSETPFMTVMCGSVLLALVGMRQASPKKLAAGGALAGLACLFRPIALLIPLVLGLAAAWFVKASRVRRAAAGLVVVTAAGAVLMPWVGWIRFRTGEWLMVSSGGPPTLRDGLSFNHKGFRERLDLPAGVKRLSDAAWEEYESLDSVGAYLGFVMRQAREDPLAVVQTYGYKAMRAWYGTDAQRKGGGTVQLFCQLCVSVCCRTWGFSVAAGWLAGIRDRTAGCGGAVLGDGDSGFVDCSLYDAGGSRAGPIRGGGRGRLAGAALGVCELVRYGHAKVRGDVGSSRAFWPRGGNRSFSRADGPL
jgi:4-amino-4-deoxy-L-arabinose transferase-like glycosyltransferase